MMLKDISVINSVLFQLYRHGLNRLVLRDVIELILNREQEHELDVQ